MAQFLYLAFVFIAYMFSAGQALAGDQELYDYQEISGRMISLAGGKPLIYEISFNEQNISGFVVTVNSHSYDLVALKTGIEKIHALEFGHLGFSTSDDSLTIMVSGRYNPSCPRGGLQDRSIEDLVVIDLKSGSHQWKCSNLGSGN
ncbi:MAG: hypothetical protein QM698_00765 [Micropepsaceae bacterium]